MVSDEKVGEIQGVQLFDSNCRLGPSNLTGTDSPVSVASLIDEMDRVGISEALVHHASAVGYAPTFGNERLTEELRGSGRLHGCWVLLPSHTAEIEQPASLIPKMLGAGIRAARILPRMHRFSLASWSIDGLLSALSERRIPLFVDFGRAHWADEVVDYDQVFRICTVFRDLPLVLVREGIGSNRYLYPLLERFENLFLEISYYQPADGLADVSKRFGVRHLLFGTGLPDYAAGPAISMLFRAGLSMEEKRMVGGDNLRGLLKGVG